MIYHTMLLGGPKQLILCDTLTSVTNTEWSSLLTVILGIILQELEVAESLDVWKCFQDHLLMELNDD